MKILTILTLVALFVCSSYAETDYLALPKIEKILKGQIPLRNPTVSGTLKTDTIEEFTGSAGVTVAGVSNLNGSVGATNDVVAADDVIAGDDVTAVDDVIAGDDLVGDEAVVDGKFAVTGLDAVTPLAVAHGISTNNGTVTFTAAFGGTPSVTYSWTDPITGSSTGLVADLTISTTTVLFDSPTVDVTNLTWIAVGTRP